MKTFIKYCLLLFIANASFGAYAQDSHTSDTDRKWYIPDHAVAQFAGNIGLISAGVGYSYLHDKVQTDIMYGFVPAFESNTSIHILTAKTAWHPWSVDLEKGYLLEPLRLGTGISYSYGPQFFTSLPKRYPDKYYWWASSLRFTPFIGTAISKKIGRDATMIKRVQLYGELGTTDLDVVSKFGNKHLPIWDILNLAFGTKFIF
ncbi:hypothetical protein I5M27_05515 [Adhaeribacter sp. BT258]|uniref:Outer membrane protein beta-barrel domain-containing protein n=1 Tax=Adhaeribacter terrigena TaxID=2793070 RepID=A0ABS1BZ36_9BACT|nr:hypothetical protein [Adhaeribacter terrigena]MBK0402433.1 hypothetical protein [Adhaeribacter terrigena]